MKVFLALVVLAVVLVAVQATPGKAKRYDLSKRDAELFKEWLKDRPAKLKKLKLSRHELIDRFRKFRSNLKQIRSENSVQKDTEYGLTDLSDLSPSEFTAQFVTAQTPANLKRAMAEIAQAPMVEKREIEALPKSKDWRKSSKRVVGPVVNQGSCGSCWAFATAANIEGVRALSGKSFLQLSEKQLVDCVKLAKGCNGGWMGHAYDYVIKAGGLSTDKAYPYKPSVGKCRGPRGTLTKIKGWMQIPKDHEQIKAAIVKHGPLNVIIDAGTWQNYRGGIFGSKCKTNPSHAVSLIGYGTKNGTPVWIIKNSWGTGWGIKGYAFIKRGPSSACGIHNWVLTATV